MGNGNTKIRNKDQTLEDIKKGKGLKPIKPPTTTIGNGLCMELRKMQIDDCSSKERRKNKENSK